MLSIHLILSKTYTTGQQQNGRCEKNQDEAADQVCGRARIRPDISNGTLRDYDQVRADLESEKHLQEWKATKDPEDLPSLGQYYCVECAKWFEGEHNLIAHRKGKNHKRRLVFWLLD